jgi:hypothetical protein
MSVPWRPRTARTPHALAAAVVIGRLLPAAAAADVKSYSVAVSPESVAAGRQAVMTATIRNGSAQQQLGSVNLTAPAAFTLVGASLPASAEGSATVRGAVVELRDLSLPPGGSLQVAVTVDLACAGGQYAWSVVAKQANRFNGPPGNEFVLDAARSSLTTTVVGGCALRFFTQPQDARVGERLTGTDFDPAGALVAVEVIDGDGERVDSAAPVSLGFATAGGLGTLRGTTTVAAVAGLATFGDLNVDAPGTYRLLASAAGLQPVVSVAFTIQQVAVRCVEDVDCDGELATARSQVKTTAFGNGGVDAGFLQLSFNTGFRPDCAGYEEFSADWALVLGPDRQKLVVFTVDKRVMNASPNNGVSFLQMCFAAPFPYATRTGAPPAQVDADGDGLTDWFVATLPDCGVAPCVAARHKDKAGNGVIEVRAPGGTEDPAYRP